MATPIGREETISSGYGTIYFEPEIHRALRLRAAETDRSFSELVNEAVQLSLAGDAESIRSE
ncbi:MAG: ribbon-helix-helix domain-containing protein [Desulfobacterales bacterium]